MHATINVQLPNYAKPSLRYFVIRKLVHVLQASAPLYNLGMFT